MNLAQTGGGFGQEDSSWASKRREGKTYTKQTKVLHKASFCLNYRATCLGGCCTTVGEQSSSRSEPRPVLCKYNRVSASSPGKLCGERQSNKRRLTAARIGGRGGGYEPGRHRCENDTVFIERCHGGHPIMTSAEQEGGSYVKRSSGGTSP